eukprot:tig00000042_g15493.t1
MRHLGIAAAAAALLLATAERVAGDALEDALQSYWTLHAAIMRGDAGVDRKFIVYEPPEVGLGNKVQCLVSVFLLALLTQRALLINTNAGAMDLDEILECPFERGWDFADTFGGRAPRTCSRAPLGLAAADGGLAGRPGCPLLFWDAVNGGVEGWLCRDFEGQFGSARPDFVKVVASQAPFFWTTQNPAMRGRVAALLGLPPQPLGSSLPHSVAADLYHRLARRLVRPSARVAATVDEFRRAHFGNLTVGLQVRRHSGEQYLDDEGERATLQCARTLAAQHAAAARGNVRVFLSTDWEPIRGRARDLLGEVLIYRDVPVIHDPKDSDRAEAAAVDFFLLAAADDHVVTAYSTFGHAAARLAGSDPAAVLVVSSDQYKGPLCARALHDWPAAWHLERARSASCFDPSSMLDEAGLIFPRQWDRGALVRTAEQARPVPYDCLEEQS